VLRHKISSRVFIGQAIDISYEVLDEILQFLRDGIRVQSPKEVTDSMDKAHVTNVNLELKSKLSVLFLRRYCGLGICDDVNHDRPMAV
jgi:hypothetical protein